jgi:hypothetical protein
MSETVTVTVNQLAKLKLYIEQARKFLLHENNAVRAFTYVEEAQKVMREIEETGGKWLD